MSKKFYWEDFPVGSVAEYGGVTLTKGGITADRIELRKPSQVEAGSGADAARARRVDIVSAG